MNQLNAYMALEIMHDNIERAERDRRAREAGEQPLGPRHYAVTAGRTTRFGPRRLRRALAVLRRAPATLRH